MVLELSCLTILGSSIKKVGVRRRMNMKKGVLLITVALSALLAGCGGSKESNVDSTKEKVDNEEKSNANDNSKLESYDLTQVKYKTVTEGFDWGPAITKVILNIESPIENETLSKDTFIVSSVREYYAADIVNNQMEKNLTTDTKERTIIDVYSSNEDGTKNVEGTYITIEMEVGPDITAGLPFYYNMLTNQNVYVDTSYMIKLKEGELKTKDGKTVKMEDTNKVGYEGTRNLIAENFDLTGLYEKDNITLHYASYTPESASKEEGKNPLIIWLHGAGEGGEDPTIALYGNKVVNLATEKIQDYFKDTGAYVLVPQCSTMWMDYDGAATYNNTIAGSDGKSYYTEALMELIKEYVAGHPEIDTKRIYIGGCSNGGYMTLNMLINYPDYFAAAYPICEAYSAEWLTQEKINAIKNIPIWFTHAKTDGTVPVYEGTMDYNTYTYLFKLDEQGEKIPLDDFTNAAFNRLVDAGASNVHYTLWDNVIDTSGKYFKKDSESEPYEYMGHFSWIYTLNNECMEEIDGKEVTIFDWLSKQSK